MRWIPGKRSDDVEDLRDESGPVSRGGALPRLGLGGFLVLLVLSLIFKKNLFLLLGQSADVTPPVSAPASSRPAHTAEEEKLVQFV
jgi:predicted metalloprotease